MIGKGKAEMIRQMQANDQKVQENLAEILEYFQDDPAYWVQIFMEAVGKAKAAEERHATTGRADLFLFLSMLVEIGAARLDRELFKWVETRKIATPEGYHEDEKERHDG